MAVASADFPHLWPTAATPRITLWCGADRSSLLRLPVTTEKEVVPVDVARPPAGPDPGWALSGKPSYTVHEDRTNGEITVTLGLRSQLSTPAGAVLNNDEVFSASVRPQRPDAARLEGRSIFEVDMAAGEKVVVRTEALYGKRASACHGSVVVDGVSIFDHRWDNWEGAV